MRAEGRFFAKLPTAATVGVPKFSTKLPKKERARRRALLCPSAVRAARAAAAAAAHRSGRRGADAPCGRLVARGGAELGGPLHRQYALPSGWQALGLAHLSAIELKAACD